MEIIMVPNIAPGCPERTVFDKVELFARWTGDLVKLSKADRVRPSQIQDIMSSIEKNEKCQALPGIRTFFDSLKQAILSYEVPNQDSASVMLGENMFTTAHLNKWTADIASLKSLLNDYYKTMKILQKKQEDCWKAKAKVDKYELMIATAQSALRYNFSQYEKRRDSMQSLHEMLHERISQYEKCKSHYRDNLTKEQQLRQQLIKEGYRLIQDIKDRVSEKIKESLFHLTTICCPLVLPEVDANAVAAEICSLNATHYNLFIPIDCSIYPQFNSRLSLPCKLSGKCSTSVDNDIKETTPATMDTEGTLSEDVIGK
ncbi:hypothetical protein CHS0354_008511 [Potamilus streckersoni]|uniref:Uncharacterized protein n=1 Tax=Potamilus streckersoni TaxID=2493646 RepID=A0AAE0S8U1_9BIVA|nr:hypothetical protein CHS0354_008511 [Potamilus streckersoni]